MELTTSCLFSTDESSNITSLLEACRENGGQFDDVN
jgi:hypothetical protein